MKTMLYHDGQVALPGDLCQDAHSGTCRLIGFDPDTDQAIMSNVQTGELFSIECLAEWDRLQFGQAAHAAKLASAQRAIEERPDLEAADIYDAIVDYGKHDEPAPVAAPELLKALKAATERMEAVAAGIPVENRAEGVSQAAHVRHMAGHLAQHAKLARAAIAQAEGRTDGEYSITCDDCKREIGRTDSVRRSAEGGRCDGCKALTPAQLHELGR